MNLSDLPLDEVSADEPDYAPQVSEVGEDAFQFFEFDQALLVEALAERIFPSDELGPGAPEAGVVFFIDHELAGAWGEGANHYMEGPFYPEEAVPEQGWQYRLVPNEAYEHALQAIDEYAQAEYGNLFVDLSGQNQDAIIEALAADEVDTFRGLAPSDFFAMLRSNVLQGMYSDPMYGGNRNMVGWELKEFPGAPASYISYREQIGSDEFIEVPPRSLAQIVEENEAGELSLDLDTGPHTHGGDQTSTGNATDTADVTDTGNVTETTPDNETTGGDSDG